MPMLFWGGIDRGIALNDSHFVVIPVDLEKGNILNRP